MLVADWMGGLVMVFDWTAGSMLLFDRLLAVNFSSLLCRPKETLSGF
jgi:hypothetical protein